MKKIIYVALALFVFVAGCSTTPVEQEPILDTEIILASEPAAKVQKTSWETFREYVTTNDISEAYFDEHFVFLNSEGGVQIRSDTFDRMKNEFPVIIQDAELVRYKIVLKDKVGREYLVNDYSDGAYLHNGEVLKQHYTGPTRELNLRVDKFAAVQHAKAVVACTDKQHFDVSEARENLELVYTKDRLAWSWASKGNVCLIDAETPGEVEVMII